jgi:hypothetical protein
VLDPSRIHFSTSHVRIHVAGPVRADFLRAEPVTQGRCSLERVGKDLICSRLVPTVTWPEFHDFFINLRTLDWNMNVVVDNQMEDGIS